MAGRPPRDEIRPGVMKLSLLEEKVIIQHILDLDSRGFAPRLTSIKDIANLILKSRGQNPIGTRWA